MKTIYLNLDGTRITDVAETHNAPDGYIAHECESYPNNLLTQAYRLLNGVITLDDDLYAEYLAAIEEAQEETPTVEEAQEETPIDGEEVPTGEEEQSE